MIIAIVVAVVVLAGGGIAAGIALTGGNDGKKLAGSGSPTATASQSEDFPVQSSAPVDTGSVAPPTDSGGGPSINAGNAEPTIVGTQYFLALSAHSLESLKSIACPSTHITLSQAELNKITSAHPDGPASVSGTTATEVGTVTASDGSSARIEAVLRQESGKWCLAKTQSAH